MINEIRLCKCGHGLRLHTDETPGREAPCACQWAACKCAAYVPIADTPCICGHFKAWHHRREVTGAAFSPCGQCACGNYLPNDLTPCGCGHAYARHRREIPEAAGAACADCNCANPYEPNDPALDIPTLEQLTAPREASPAPCNCEQSRALLKGRADLAHAITAATRAGALITIGPFGGGDDAAIRVSIEYRNAQITGTMADPFEALALALAQWVRVHG